MQPDRNQNSHGYRFSKLRAGHGRNTDDPRVAEVFHGQPPGRAAAVACPAQRAACRDFPAQQAEHSLARLTDHGPVRT
jgi:hypothetical protein